MCRCGRAGWDGEEAWVVERVVNDTKDNLQ